MRDSSLSDKLAKVPVSIQPGDTIERPDLVALVTNSIRQQILEGKHPPGSVLPAQGKLATTFNVSRNVIREAMRNLRSLGMVEVSQGRPPQVKRINPDASINAFSIMLAHASGSLYHLMEARIPLEIHVAALAAERATRKDLDTIAENVVEMEQIQDAVEPEALAEADQAFHCSLAKATGNPILLVMVNTLAGLQVRLTEDVYITRADLMTTTITDHRRIFEAIKQHDEKAAGQAMLEHLEAVLWKIPKDQDPTEPLSLDRFYALSFPKRVKVGTKPSLETQS